jgi:hypothetical protein
MSSRLAKAEPVFVIAPWCDDSPDWCSDGVSPSQELSALAVVNRCQSPPSSRCRANAVRVSTPRKQRSPPRLVLAQA